MSKRFDTISKVNKITQVAVTAWSDPGFRRAVKWTSALVTTLGLLIWGLASLVLMTPQKAEASVSYVDTGTIDISASGGTTVDPVYPATVNANDLLVLIIGMKPSGVVSGGSVTTPGDWTPITSLVGAGGYTAVPAADSGNTNLFAFYKVADGTEDGAGLSVTIATNGVSWANIYRFTNGTGSWSVAGATGSDVTGGAAVSIGFGSNPGVTAGDYVLAAMCIPTDVTTPSQFTSEALTQTGVTFGTVTEIQEPDSNTGYDIGGFVVRAPVDSGTGTANPTMTATAATTYTNVRGPGIFIRIRESNTAPTLSVAQPDGTGDSVNIGDLYDVTYTLTDPDPLQTVTAAFYYDSTSSGLDGTAITGACATAAEGTGVTCSWDTSGMTAGSYYVYGIANDGIAGDLAEMKGKIHKDIEVTFEKKKNTTNLNEHQLETRISGDIETAKKRIDHEVDDEIKGL